MNYKGGYWICAHCGQRNYVNGSPLLGVVKPTIKGQCQHCKKSNKAPFDPK